MSASQEGARGRATRQRILQTAVEVARAEGLEALTIGRLATALSLSKAGLFGHFGSKEELQLATVDAAALEFAQQVIAPAAALESALPRLFVLLTTWLAYAEGSPGGCFFASVGAEFDGRSGPVRDRIAYAVGQWWDGLTATIEEAQSAGDLAASTSASELSFEVYGIVLAANVARQLRGDREARAIAERSLRSRLLGHATPSGRAKLARLLPAPTGAARSSSRSAGKHEAARKVRPRPP